MAETRHFAPIPAYRPDGFLVWLPPGLAGQLGIARGGKISGETWENQELSALIFSRQKANEAGVHCDAVWHKKNGFN